MLEMQRQAYELRQRLMNPPNAVKDKPINLSLRRKPGIRGVKGAEFARLRLEEKEARRVRARAAKIEAMADKIEQAVAEAELDPNIVVERVAIRARPVVKLGPIASPAVPTIRRIQDVVCVRYAITRNDLLCMQRKEVLVRPRHIAFYLCKQLTQKSLPEIGRHFGGRDHTTVLHAVRKVATRVENDPDFAAEIAGLMQVLETEQD